MNMFSNSRRLNVIDPASFKLLAGLLPAVILMLFITGCTKKSASGAGAAPSASQQGTAPAPAPTPSEPTTIQQPTNGDINATLAQLTKELRRTMVGRRLNRNFDEFVALRNLQVPPPPPGKKYAISQQWKVILVDN